MARVMNQRSQLPTTILVTTIEQFVDSGISHEFIGELTLHPYNNIGVKRKTHFILKTAETIIQPQVKRVYECNRLRKILDRCFLRGFDMVMINF